MKELLTFFGIVLVLALGQTFYNSERSGSAAAKNIPALVAPQTDEARLGEKVFNAVKDKDWGAFKALYQNRYNIIARKNDPNPFAAQQSYAGGMMAPEEEMRVKHKFESLAQGSAGQIDFAKETFKDLVSLGTEEDGVIKDMSGYSVAVEVFGIITQENEDSRRLPLLVIRKNNGITRILDFVME